MNKIKPLKRNTVAQYSLLVILLLMIQTNLKTNVNQQENSPSP